MNSTLFPEHESLVSELIQLHEGGRLPHALLLTSDSGLGLSEVCEVLAHRLLKSVFRGRNARIAGSRHPWRFSLRIGDRWQAEYWCGSGAGSLRFCRQNGGLWFAKSTGD